MTVTITSTLSNSVQALYQSAYMLAARRKYIYSQKPLAFTPPKGILDSGNRGSSVKIPVYFELQPVVSAASQTADVKPVTTADALITVTPDMYINAVQIAQKLSVTAFTDVERMYAELVAANMAESMDYLCRTQAVGGSVVIYGNDATSRVTCGSADELDTVDFFNAIAHLEGGRAPKLAGGPNGASGYAAVISPVVVFDLIEDAVLILIAEYGGKPEQLLNNELGTVAGGRLLPSNFSKIFHAAGATLSGLTTTTLNGAVAAGDTSVIITANSGGGNGQYWNIGTAESSENAITETVRVTANGTTTTATIVGGGPNGGLLYAHDTAAAGTHSYDVHATGFLGSESLLKVYSNEDDLGPDGTIIPYEKTGLAKQFNSMAWKHFTGFGRVADSRIFRVESIAARMVIGK